MNKWLVAAVGIVASLDNQLSGQLRIVVSNGCCFAGPLATVFWIEIIRPQQKRSSTTLNFSQQFPVKCPANRLAEKLVLSAHDVAVESLLQQVQAIANRIKLGFLTII